MHPSDFHVRTLDGVADNWPIGYWTLEPYFAENDRMMGVAGLAGDPGLFRARAHHAPVPLGRSGTRYARAAQRARCGTGWRRPTFPWRPRTTMDAPGASTSATARRAAAGAKASVDITVLASRP